MARINLLPWRDDRRQIRKREFWTQMGVAAAISVLAVFGGMMFMDTQNELQEANNAFLTAEIKKLDDKIVEIQALEKSKAKLLKKKEIIENLQGDRSLMVHIFEQMARTIPDGVALGAIKQTADSIQLDGKAQSEARVAQYMRNLDDSPYLKDPDLNIVAFQDPAAAAAGPAGAKAVDVKSGGYRKGFTLKISIDRPKDMTVLPEPGQTTADPVAMAAVAPSPLDPMPSAASAEAEVVPELATQPETLPKRGAK
jgi:type IV pilus assembly protein PilN